MDNYQAGYQAGFNDGKPNGWELASFGAQFATLGLILAWILMVAL